jgi:tungstate transport system ATP-binding protein
MGHNGAGKTTLLKILAGLEIPTTGKLVFRDSEVTRNNLDLVRGKATMLFQTPLFLRGDVYSNIAFGLRIRKVSEEEIRERIAEALKGVRLEGFEERDARALSGGEQQRVAMARALILDPEILLLDEPTSNLDPANSSVLAEIVSEESKRRCIVLATHDYDQIKRLTKRTIYLENGRVKDEGTTEQVFSVSRLEDNVFTGGSRTLDGVTYVDIGKGVEIAAAFNREGRLTIHVRPEDIILSKSPIESSARNMLGGAIVGLEDTGSIVRLRVDVGRVFTVQVTKKSFLEMGLNVGQKVYITFKASSVQLI